MQNCKMAFAVCLLLLAAAMFVSCAFGKKGKTEETVGKTGDNLGYVLADDETPPTNIRLIDCSALGMYRGAAGITVTGKLKTFEVTTSSGYVGNFTIGFQKNTTATLSGDWDEAETGNLYVFNCSEESEDTYRQLLPFETDRVLLRIIVRENDRITGYALVAFWEKLTDADPCFHSGKVLKEVTFRKNEDGTYPDITLEEVNARLDRAERELATEELFKTTYSISRSE